MIMPRPAQDRTPMSIAEFTAELLSFYAAQRYRATTVEKVRHALNLLVELAGVQTSSDINDEAIRRFVERHPAGWRPHTLYAYLTALRAAFNNAVTLGLLSAAPAFPQIPQVGERSAGPWFQEETPTPEDIERVMTGLREQAGTWEGHRLYALAATVVYTGLLKLETLWLRIEDCDLDGETIRVRSRELTAGASRPSVVPIPPPLGYVLIEWLPRAGPEWLFPNKTRSGPWTGGAAGNKPLDQLRAAGRAVGVAGVSFEALRRFNRAHATPDTDFIIGRGPAFAPVAPPVESRDVAGPLLHQPTAPPDAGHAPTSLPVRARPFRLDDATRLMVHLLKESSTWEGHRLYAAAGLALFTGLRRGKVLGLAVANCDVERRLIRVDDRPIPAVIPEVAAQILADWLPRSGGTPWVFPGSKLGGPWIGGRPGRKPLDQLRQAGREVGIEGVTFETLRHLWEKHAGRFTLGSAFQPLRPPARDNEGPSPRPPGPKPRNGDPARTRAKHRVVPTQAPPGPTPHGPTVARPAEARGSGPPVLQLTAVDAPPVIRGQRMEWTIPLSLHNILKAMLDAGCLAGTRLTESELAEKSGHPNPVRTFRRFRSHPVQGLVWRTIFVFPGRNGRGGYGLAPR